MLLLLDETSHAISTGALTSRHSKKERLQLFVWPRPSLHFWKSSSKNPANLESQASVEERKSHCLRN